MTIMFVKVQKTFIFASSKRDRGVAQLASVLAWGARGRKFESSHPDYLKRQIGANKRQNPLILGLTGFFFGAS